MDTSVSISLIGGLIGLIGGLAGLIALIIQGVQLWKRRYPRLKLFVPYHFTGSASHNQQRVLFCLVRISNLSERPAFIYLETLRAEVLFKGRWYQMSVISFPKDKPLETDFPEHILYEAGLKDVQHFNKFSGPVISLDNPYSSYIPITYSEHAVVEGAERLRLEFKDCNLKKYVIDAEVLDNDPQNT